MKQGFTLVELAIVLVIIGLLVGGVLQGQELIKIAKYNSQISEWEDLKHGWFAYYSKYNKYPGDDNKATTWFGNDTANGDNNGNIGSSNSRTFYDLDSLPQNEPCLVFQHLMMAELLKADFTLGADDCEQSWPTPGPITGRAPTLIDDRVNKSYVIISDTSTTSSPWTLISGEKLVCTIGTQGSTMHTGSNVSGGYAALKPEEANYFDTKLDDGIPTTGKTRAVIGSTNSYAQTCSMKMDTITGANPGTGSDCGNSSGYNLTETRLACSLTIKMGF